MLNKIFWKLGLLVAFFALLFLEVGKIFQLTTKAAWDGRNRLNLVVNSSPMGILSFAPKEDKSLALLLIPENSLIETIHGFGNYQFGSIYNLGALENKGDQLLVGTAQNFFALPIDGLLTLKNFITKNQSLEETRNLITKNLWQIFRVGENHYLNRWDFLRLWWLARNLRQDRLKIIDLAQTGAFTEVTLADGSQVRKIDLTRADKTIGEYFKDEEIAKEDFSIAVLNGTAFTGLANQAVRLVNNLGGRVIEVGNWEEKVSDCEIISSKSITRSYTVKKLKKIFACRWISGDLGNHRADLLLILGEKFWEKMTKKTADF